ncbi:hypothetical protein ACPCTO_24970 [Streptomyces olivoreticuli]
MTDLYGLDIDNAQFSKACGGNTHPDGEACVTLARIGVDAWAMGDSKRPNAEPQRYREAVAEWKTTDVPPIETAYWLMKPSRLIKGTWDEPKEAAEWLGERLTEHAPRFASDHDQDTTRLAVLVASAAERLALGGDASLGFYLRGTLFLSVALVTCSPNRAAPELSCPLG